MIPRILVIDNGADTAKVGYAGEKYPRVFMNAICTQNKTKYVGIEKNELKHTPGTRFKRPFEKGYLTDWEIEQEIWQSIFTKDNIVTSECGLLYSEPPFTPKKIKKTSYEIIFEDFNFQAVYSCSASRLSLFNYKDLYPASDIANSPCALVVDSGFSFSHAMPVFIDSVLNYGVRRVDVGGKLLTNYLKDLLSYRKWDMTEEPALVKILKEKACHVSTNFLKDMLTFENSGANHCNYVLPDYITDFSGYIYDPKKNDQEADSNQNPKITKESQILNLGNECISIPELLFSPSDIGINQGGIPQAILEAVYSCHRDTRAALFGNILLTGGNTLFKGYVARMKDELRKIVPSEYKIGVSCSDNPLLSAWYGGSALALQHNFNRYAISKQDYEEKGVDYVMQSLLV